MIGIISRRRLLARAVVGGLAAALHIRPSLAARRRLPVYVLDPVGSDGNGCCASCRACRLHAENKLFASAADADAHRAHANCDCAVRQAGELPPLLWSAFFDPGRQVAGQQGMVDRRHKNVAKLLAKYDVELA